MVLAVDQFKDTPQEQESISISVEVSKKEIFHTATKGVLSSLAVILLAGAVLAAKEEKAIRAIAPHQQTSIVQIDQSSRKINWTQILCGALMLPPAIYSFTIGQELERLIHKRKYALAANEAIHEMGITQGLSSLESRQQMANIVEAAKQLKPQIAEIQKLRDSGISFPHLASIASGKGLAGIIEYEAMREVQEMNVYRHNDHDDEHEQPQVLEGVVPVAAIAPSPRVANILKTSQLPVVGLNIEWAETLDAPNLTKEVFALNSGVDKLNKFEKELSLAFGQYIGVGIHAPHQIYVDIPKKDSERKYPYFPREFDWVEGEAKLLLGENTKGQIIIDLASEVTPHIMVGGTTGGGKTASVLRPIAYSLLQQNCEVCVIGGKISDYEDLIENFGLKFYPNEEAYDIAAEFADDCRRLRGASKAELESEKRRVLLIDEYGGTVMATLAVAEDLVSQFAAELIDEDPGKPQSRVNEYDRNLCEIARLGRALKRHLVFATQRVALRSNSDPDGFPAPVRACLPAKIALRCVSQNEGNLILNGEGDRVCSLQGRGDAIIVAGGINERYQGYRV